MKNNLVRSLLLFAVAVLFAAGAHAQVVAAGGTPHGVQLTFTASTSTVQGYYIFRCIGTCTTSSTGWVSVSNLINSTNFLDPQAGLTLNTTYSYAVAAVDAAGSQSSFSNIATVSLPSTWPANPNPATNLTATVK